MKSIKNTEGFSLTEVMIGMMVLTVAIVSATNLLVGLIQSNKSITETMQAHYYAQEGLEAVRNIRDTHWLHNVDWRGGEIGFDRLEEGRAYSVQLESAGWRNSNAEELSDVAALAAYNPWSFLDRGDSEVISGFEPFFEVKSVEDELTGFYRHINILPYEDGNNPDFVVVEAVVQWDQDREVKLHEVLSNWKGGAL